MFKRSLVPVWIAIIFLSGMFLMGQDSWIPSPDPTVVGIDPPEAQVGEVVLFYGGGLGNSQGASAVSFNGVDAGPAALWGDGALKNVILLGIGETFFYHPLEVALNGKVPV